MAASGLHISISAETIGHVGGLAISNSMFTSLIVTALLLFFGVMVRSQLKTQGRPGKLQNFAEFLVESLMGLVTSVTGSEQKTRLFFPLIASFFLFILLNNWLGLFPGVGTIGFTETATEEHAVSLTTQPVTIPVSQVSAAETIAQTHEEEEVPTEFHTESEDVSTGHEEEVILMENADHADTTHQSDEPHTTFVPYLRAGTADLNTTLALAAISVVMTQVFGFHYQKFAYFKKFINFSSPIAFFIGLLEIVLEFAKILSFAFRLFGNIFAGEVLLVVIAFLVPIIVPMPFYGLEVIVGAIQALVFAMLTAVFFNMATHGHEDH